MDNDLERIINAGNAYLLFVYWEGDKDNWKPLVNELKKIGFVKEIMDYHETKLFYFSTDKERL